jgi:hypothetical protein
MGTDSKAFADAFANMKRAFVDTPRNVVRFTNLARFLYSVVAAEYPRPDDEEWAPSFFDVLVARWKGAHEDPPSCPAWLRREMDQWLPVGNVAPNGAAGPARAEGPHARGTERSGVQSAAREGEPRRVV